ncbi:MAG: 3-phosphoserine/phosphohydroxythreonine transaminase, partial [Vallitaleaceae bacterium]|nr:3-phosphoserine/phosphohydroxythreonine transaminase [Vallitaleaceae bacterium]
PCTLPVEVLEQAAKEMLNYEGTGMSVMEMSHRSKAYIAIIEEAEADLREIMGIPNNYKVLFLQGGATTQFSAVPMNLLTGSKKADYFDTGIFATKAIKEAKRYGDINVVASSKDNGYKNIPEYESSQLDPEADYVYLTSNNTIFGTRFNEFPDTKDVPLVVDMSSEILSREIDVSKFGLIYAGAQKNMGTAGLTVVIVREDLMGKAMPLTPTMLNYKVEADASSMLNTPPTYSIYIPGLVFKWIKNNGGVVATQKRNEEKAALLYDCIDKSKLFKGVADLGSRSIMNVTFTTGSADLDAKFIQEAAEKDVVNIKGHRSAGGMRASIYNAMSIEGIKALIEAMKAFEQAN